MTARIILGADHAAAIRAAARKAFPRECCGLLIGTGDTVTRIAAAPNAAPDPTRHFEIDPRFLFDQMRSARNTNTEILGHYHSHPNGPPEPSAKDLGMAHDPGAVWVIAAVTGEQVSLRAFVAPGGGFREIPIL